MFPRKPTDEARQAFVGAVHRVSRPLDGLSCTCGVTRSALTLRDLVSCRERPWELPFRAFSSPPALDTFLGDHCSHRVPLRGAKRRQGESLRRHFQPRQPTGVGNRDPRDDGSELAPQPDLPHRTRSLLAAKAALRALFRRRLRSRILNHPGQGGKDRPLLSWVFPSRVFSTTAWVRSFVNNPRSSARPGRGESH